MEHLEGRTANNNDGGYDLDGRRYILENIIQQVETLHK
jgi:hypothetical protein